MDIFGEQPKYATNSLICKRDEESKNFEISKCLQCLVIEELNAECFQLSLESAISNIAPSDIIKMEIKMEKKLWMATVIYQQFVTIGLPD